MIITTEQYLSHYNHENVQPFLNHLFESKTVVFIGYGLAEAELLEHILRRGSARKSEPLKLFSLKGYYSSQSILYQHLHEYYMETFGLQLLGYLLDEEEYSILDRIVAQWAQEITVESNTPSQDATN